MNPQPLTIPTSRAWLGGCNCPPNQCQAKEARKCADWSKRNEKR